jgi:hypothetical protein
MTLSLYPCHCRKRSDPDCPLIPLSLSLQRAARRNNPRLHLPCHCEPHSGVAIQPDTLASRTTIPTGSPRRPFQAFLAMTLSCFTVLAGSSPVRQASPTPLPPCHCEPRSGVAIQPNTLASRTTIPTGSPCRPFQAFLAMTLSLFTVLSGLPRDDRNAAGGLGVSGSRGMFILFSREGLDKVTLSAQPHQKP